MYNLLLRVKCYLLLSIKTIKFENIRWVVANNIILDKTERQTDHSDDGNRIYRFKGNGNEMEELDYVFGARLGDLTEVVGPGKKVVYLWFPFMYVRTDKILTSQIKICNLCLKSKQS